MHKYIQEHKSIKGGFLKQKKHKKEVKNGRKTARKGKKNTGGN